MRVDLLHLGGAKPDFHSKGSKYFLSLLHSLQQGTRLDLMLFPPLVKGMRWSMVSSLAGNFF